MPFFFGIFRKRLPNVEWYVIRRFWIDVTVCKAAQEPPEYQKRAFCLDEVHPTFGNRGMSIISQHYSRKVLKFSIEPSSSVSFDAAFTPIENQFLFVQRDFWFEIIGQVLQKLTFHKAS